MDSNLAERLFQCPIGEHVNLDPPITVAGEAVSKIHVEKEMRSATRPRKIRLEGPSGNSRHYLLKREELIKEYAVMRLLDMMNEVWDRNGVKFDGLPIRAKTYGILPLHQDAGLIEFVPNSETLDRLKRKSPAQVANRVSDYLRNDAQYLQNLVSSSIAFLVSNYILGVRDGHGDNVMLTEEGILFRIDFGFVWGRSPVMDAPNLWLPWAVRNALGPDRWNKVLAKSCEALWIAAPWVMQSVPQDHKLYHKYACSAFLLIDRELKCNAFDYSMALREDGIEGFYRCMRAIGEPWSCSSLRKDIKSFFHYRFGYISRKADLGAVDGEHFHSQQHRKAFSMQLEALTSFSCHVQYSYLWVERFAAIRQGQAYPTCVVVASRICAELMLIGVATAAKKVFRRIAEAAKKDQTQKVFNGVAEAAKTAQIQKVFNGIAEAAKTAQIQKVFNGIAEAAKTAQIQKVFDGVAEAAKTAQIQKVFNGVAEAAQAAQIQKVFDGVAEAAKTAQIQKVFNGVAEAAQAAQWRTRESISLLIAYATIAIIKLIKLSTKQLL